MAGALDDWSGVRQVMGRRDWVTLTEVARIADPDPWRERHDPVHPKQFAELDTEAVL